MTAFERIARIASACFAVGIGIYAIGVALDGGLTKFSLTRSAVAADPASAASAPAEENSARAVEGHPAAWRVVAAAGSPVYRHLEQTMSGWQPVPVGLTLASYAEIDTGSGGRLELSNGNDRMILAPNTAVALPPAAADIPDVTIFQSSGQADYKVRSRRKSSDSLLSRIGHLFLAGSSPTGRFDVYTPHLVAAVKGTAFRVSVNDQGASVSVTEGVVSVSDVKDGRTAEVRGGKTATADSSTGGLVVGTSPGNRNSQGDNAQGGNSQGENGRGNSGQDDNGQGDNGQGDNGRSGNDNSQ